MKVISPIILVAQQCPWDMENCIGLCGRFIDEDGDGFCDLGRVVKTEVNKDVDSIVSEQTNLQLENNQKDNINVIAHAPTEPKTSNKPKEDNTIETNKTDHQTQMTETTDASISIKKEKSILHTTSRKPRYALIFYTSLTFGLYFLSLLFLKLRIYKRRIHRKIWNILLLITFLFSGLLGLFMVLQINYGLYQYQFLTFLKWHVEFGIVMALISFFHIFWHLAYFKNIFKTIHSDKK